MTKFNNRVFGCAIVKAINANYNADFSHQPRTLPDGVVYATDKAFKYSVRHYLKNEYPKETIFFYKRLDEELKPLTLDETFHKLFGKNSNEQPKVETLKELTNCIDIRLFGATFASKLKIDNKSISLSLYGTLQISHGMNRFDENDIYSEQIMSPFRNPSEDGKEDKSMTTLGQQSKLREGHYVHHFSVNPKNLSNVEAYAKGISVLNQGDIQKAKEAMCRGISYYDSSAKAGIDNELLLWIELKEQSKLVLPSLTEMINVYRESEVVIDFAKVTELLMSVSGEINKVEVYYNPQNTRLQNAPQNSNFFHLTTMKALKEKINE